MPPGDPFGIHGPCHLMRLIIRNKNIIWFMGGDLNCFRDIKHFVKRRGWGMPPGDMQGSQDSCH